MTDAFVAGLILGGMFVNRATVIGRKVLRFLPGAPRIEAKDSAQPDSPPLLLPDNVLDYCNHDSEEFAREDCKKRARRMFPDSGNWEVVLVQLKRADGEIA